MKRIISVLCTLVFLASVCSGCGSRPAKLGPGDMLDTDTGKIYSLGDERAIFDEAFGYMGIKEKADDNNVVDYLGGVLRVTFDDGKAVELRADGPSTRFEFYQFTFSTEISDIEGRYNKDDYPAGYIFYNRYYDENGKDTNRVNAAYEHTLMVRDGDMLDMKDGDYVHYFIETMSN